MPNYTRTGLKLTGNGTYGVMNLNVKFKLSICRREIQQRYNCVQPSIKHGGGSAIIRGCFSASAVGDHENTETYHQIY